MRNLQRSAALLVWIVPMTCLEAAEPTAGMIENRPKVPGVLELNLRERTTEAGGGKVNVVDRTVRWNVAETAIIVCDMWDDHHCKISAQRVGVLAPRMNQVLTATRDHGFHSMIARIVGGHDASIALHRACGFSEIGIEREVGRKFGQWLDVVLMQRML